MTKIERKKKGRQKKTMNNLQLLFAVKVGGNEKLRVMYHITQGEFPYFSYFFSSFGTSVKMVKKENPFKRKLTAR